MRPRSAFAAWAPAALIASAALLCYGGHRIATLGFYHDDWAFLATLHHAGDGFGARMAALAREHSSLWFRPLELPLYALLFSLFGAQPLPWQLTLLVVNAATAGAVYRVLRAFEIPRRLALLGALIFLAYPSKDATMFWPIVMVNSLALLFWLAAYSFHLDFVRAGKKTALALALSLLAASLAVYDHCFMLFPLWLVTPGFFSAGVGRRAWIGGAAAGATTGAALFLKLIVVPRAVGVAFNKPLVVSAENFISVYWKGLKACLGSEAAGAAFDFAKLGLTMLPLVAICGIALPWIALAWKHEPSPRNGRRSLLVLGAGLFVLGYLPLAVSDYIPQALNHMNRINQVPVLGVVLALSGVAAEFGRRLEPVAAGLASLFLAAHVGAALAWAESYRLQLSVRDLMLRELHRWPPDKKLLLLQPRRFVRGKAPIFVASWDISGAARLWTGDRARRADVVDGSTDFRAEGVVQRGQLLPYSDVRILDVSAGMLPEKLDHRRFARIP